MNDRIQSLEQLVETVQAMVAGERWDELSELDDSARLTVERATELAREGHADEAHVRQLIEQLVGLYDQARTRAEQERDEAERGLRDTSRTQRAANAYLNNQ